MSRNVKKHCFSNGSCSGPILLHNRDAVIAVDYTANVEVPRYGEELRGKETVLDTSYPYDSGSPIYIPCPTDDKDFKENNPVFLSFSSQKSDETESDDVDSSQKKLMSTPDVSYIDMICPEKKEDHEKKRNGHHKHSTRCSVYACITSSITSFKQFLVDHQKVLKFIFKVIFCLGVTAYMCVALLINFYRALPLLTIWCLVVLYNVYAFFRDRFGKQIQAGILDGQATCKCSGKSKYLQWLLYLVVLGGLATWIALDTAKRPKQLISAVGYFFFVTCLFFTSKYPERVNWRPVVWGLTIQVCLGLIVLRTDFGFHAFNWLGELAQTFINYVTLGAKFVFGNLDDHLFAFKILPIILYFSAFISVLYYLGAMQWLIFKIAWLMQISLNTSATESMVAAGNIFVGQTESPLLIRPYIDDLTTSELHAVMTAGFGTVAGSVLGAYLSFGVRAVYVVTACVMAAPCALAISKLSYPETKQSKFDTADGLKLEKTEQRNVIEAAFVGASQAIPLVLNIGANLIAFLSLLAALNGFLSWFGSLTDYGQLTFQVICSYLFMPMTFLMGVDWQDCFKAAELIGTKIFINEFVAYEALSELIKARDNGTIPRLDLSTGEANWIDERTEAIVTYALCGFANIGSVGIMLGGLGSLAPKRQGEMADIVIRALISGILVSILNACVAGFLYDPRPIVCTNMLNTTNWTYTEPSRLFECCSNIAQTNGTLASNCCAYNWTASQHQSLNCNGLLAL